MFAKNILFLDIGSSTLKGVVINEKKFKILAKMTQENPGIANGYIANTETFQNALKKLISNLEKKTKSRINSTVLIIGGKIVEYKLLVSSEIQVEGIIDDNTMRSIDKKIKNWADKKNVILIRSTPVEYKIDGSSVENAFGLYADTIQFTYFLSYAPMNMLGNLVHILEKNGLNIIDILPSIYCCAALHLSDDEKKLGSLIFDIGAHSVNWAYFFENKPIAAGSSINIGSEMITNKIAKSLKISIEQAKQIKHTHTSAIISSSNFCSWIEFQRDNNPDYILESEVIRKITPEVSTIIDMIIKVINHFQKKAYLAVLCGNGSWLSGLSDAVAKHTNIGIKLTPSSFPEYDAIMGAIVAFQYDAKTKNKGMIRKAASWLKENL